MTYLFWKTQRRVLAWQNKTKSKMAAHLPITWVSLLAPLKINPHSFLHLCDFSLTCCGHLNLPLKLHNTPAGELARIKREGLFWRQRLVKSTAWFWGVANPLLATEKSGSVHSLRAGHKSTMNGPSDVTAIHTAYTTMLGIYHASDTSEEQPDKPFIHFRSENYHCACGKRPKPYSQRHGNC